MLLPLLEQPLVIQIGNFIAAHLYFIFAAFNTIAFFILPIVYIYILHKKTNFALKTKLIFSILLSVFPLIYLVQLILSHFLLISNQDSRGWWNYEGAYLVITFVSLLTPIFQFIIFDKSRKQLQKGFNRFILIVTSAMLLYYLLLAYFSWYCATGFCVF